MYLKGLYYDFWSRFVTRSVHEKLMSIIRGSHLLPAGAKVLDVGCGTGFYSRAFPSHAYAGIELSFACAAYGRRKYGKNLVCQNAASLGFHDGSFDFAFSTNLIHHLDDGALAQMLKGMLRCLKPVGTLALYDVYRDQGQSPLLRLAYDLDLGAHVRRKERLLEIFNKELPGHGVSFFKAGIYDYYSISYRKESA